MGKSEEANKKSKRGRKSRTFQKVLFSSLRFTFFVGGMVLVFSGWIRSFEKYIAADTSVSSTINETALWKYPSITFCPKFKGYADLREKFWELENKNFNVSDFLEPHSKSRTFFLNMFNHAHPEWGGHSSGYHILSDDKYWTESVPHPKESGKCFTYDPLWKSPATRWYAIRFSLKFDGQNFTDREREMLDFDIFIHDAGKFMYYKNVDRPNSYKIEMSWLKPHTPDRKVSNELILDYQALTSLNQPSMPCSNDPSYDFNRCVETAYSKERGCQWPWAFDPNVNISMCLNGDTDSQDLNRIHFASLEISNKSGCVLPCKNSIWSLEYTTRIDDQRFPEDNNGDWIIYLWFKNFKFKYDTEYQICNYTCLIGELGGNLGFFLGGSIIGFLDILLLWTLKFEDNDQKKC